MGFFRRDDFTIPLLPFDPSGFYNRAEDKRPFREALGLRDLADAGDTAVYQHCHDPGVGPGSRLTVAFDELRWFVGGGNLDITGDIGECGQEESGFLNERLTYEHDSASKSMREFIPSLRRKF